MSESDPTGLAGDAECDGFCQTATALYTGSPLGGWQGTKQTYATRGGESYPVSTGAALNLYQHGATLSSGVEQSLTQQGFLAPAQSLQAMIDPEIFIGGARDAGNSGPGHYQTVKNYADDFAALNPDLITKYFMHDQGPDMSSYIDGQAAGTPINMICHSLGCNTAGNYVTSHPGVVSNLFMIDPVGSGGGLFEADAAFFSSVRSSVRNFVDVNAVGGGSLNGSNVVAGFGSLFIAKHSYDSGPRGIANRYIESNHSHGDFYGLMQDAVGPLSNARTTITRAPQ